MELSILATDLDKVFNGEPWYGDGVIERLNKVTSEHIQRSPAGSAHSIPQLVRHMTAWTIYVCEILEGNSSYAIAEDSTENFPTDNEPTRWSEYVSDLTNAHQRLTELLTGKDDEWSRQHAPGTSFTNGQLIRGLIDHDIYHLGQIGLLMNLTKE